MIIRIQKSGGSFRGAGLYYLHDKSEDAALEKHLKPQTDQRVWFTDTRNCLEQDPGRALEEMWRTAEDQAYLKMQAGVKRGGRVCEEPVKTMSLSWHKDDAPTPEHMIEAADAFLKHMKWDEHQAVLVGHNDTEHRHIHIILNRVNPDNGRTLDDFRDQKRAQSWALDYERSQDQVRCEQREINAQKEVQLRAENGAERANDSQREAAPVQQAEQTNQQQQAENAKQPERTPDAGREATAEQAGAVKSEPSIGRAANDHLPHNVIMMARPSEREFNAYEQLRAEHATADLAKQQAEDRAELKVEQRDERKAFFEDGSKLFKATRHAVYDEVRQEYKAEWRAFYKDADAAREAAETASDSAVSRAFHFAKGGEWEQAREAFGDRDSLRDAVEKELAERKADLKQRQNETLRERQQDACDSLRQVRDIQYNDLLQRQRDERATLQASAALEAAGIGQGQQTDGPAKPLPEKAANENQTAATHITAGPSREIDQGAARSVTQERASHDAPAPPTTRRRDDAAVPLEQPGPAIAPPGPIHEMHLAMLPVEPKAPGVAANVQQTAAFAQSLENLVDKAASETGASIAVPQLAGLDLPEAPTDDVGRAPARGASDLAAGGIGALAGYLADQLGELFAPTPPEVREAQAKADAKAEANREAERPARDEKAAAYDAIIESAARALAEERERTKGDEWWKERDRDKGFERDQ